MNINSKTPLFALAKERRPQFVMMMRSFHPRPKMKVEPSRCIHYIAFKDQLF